MFHVSPIVGRIAADQLRKVLGHFDLIELTARGVRTHSLVPTFFLAGGLTSTSYCDRCQSVRGHNFALSKVEPKSVSEDPNQASVGLVGRFDAASSQDPSDSCGLPHNHWR